MNPIENLADFINKVSNKKNVFFRGHSDISYKLEPTIYRKYGKSALAYIEPLKFEKFDEELKYNIKKCSIDGLKQRIEQNKQGTILTFKYFYEKNATKEEKLECIEILNNTQLLDYITYEIQKEKFNFRKVINPEHFDNAIICIKPKMDNQRIIAQQGAFLIYGIKDGNKFKIPDLKKSNIVVEDIVIPKDKKQTILDELEKIGITEQRLFPEIENSAKYIVRKFKKKL